MAVTTHYSTHVLHSGLEQPLRAAPTQKPPHVLSICQPAAEKNLCLHVLYIYSRDARTESNTIDITSTDEYMTTHCKDPRTLLQACDSRRMVVCPEAFYQKFWPWLGR